MIGDQDLNVARETGSSGWLQNFIAQAASQLEAAAILKEAIEVESAPIIAVAVPEVTSKRSSQSA